MSANHRRAGLDEWLSLHKIGFMWLVLSPLTHTGQTRRGSCWCEINWIQYTPTTSNRDRLANSRDGCLQGHFSPRLACISLTGFYSFILSTFLKTSERWVRGNIILRLSGVKLRVQGQLGLRREFQDSWGYTEKASLAKLKEQQQQKKQTKKNNLISYPLETPLINISRNLSLLFFNVTNIC